MSANASAGGNKNIRELTLSQGQTIDIPIYSDGTQPLRATICWTDPAGTPPSPSLNPPTIMLVNDVDLRVIQGVGTTFFPWVLDRNNPSAAATTSDNIRDNVEQIHISSPNAGMYTIRINHKGSLTGGSQVVSLIITGVNFPTLTVSTPNGDESWQVGSTKNIQWNSSHLTGNVKIEISFNGGSTYETLFTNTPNDGNEAWQVTGSVTSQARVRVSSIDAPSLSDISDANFTITQSSVIYVSTSGNDITGDGSSGNPFFTIQHSVNSVSAGGTINLAGGTYNESVTVDKNIVLNAASNPTIQSLTLTNGSIVDVGGNFQISDGLNLNSGLLILGSSNLTLGSSASINGTFSATNMVVTTGDGEFRKIFTGPGSFLFPVGNIVGIAGYSPVILNFTSGTFSSAYAGVKLQHIKHPLNPSVTDFINRYWTVTQNGISDFSCNVSFVYTNEDVVGIETNLTLGQYITHWNVVGSVNPQTNTLSGVVTSFSDFTGGTADALPITLASFSVMLNPIGSGVLLEWTTISEINSYGFFVERKADWDNEFNEIPNSFIPGAGTTLVPQTYSFIDNMITTAGTFHYRLRLVDNDGLVNYSQPVSINFSLLSVRETSPIEFRLHQNHPNPFNPLTKISFSLANAGYTTLKVHNLLGKEVATLFSGNGEAGKRYEVIFNAQDLSSGMYFYKLQSGNNVEIRKLTLVK